MKMKVTEKEEKVVASVISFLQGFKDCPSDKKDKFILDNAFVARNMIAFKNFEPKDSYVLLSSMIIHNMIPYLIAKDDEKIDDVAERIDKETDKMMNDMIEELKLKNTSNETLEKN